MTAWQSILADAAIILGGIVGGLTLLDFFLSKSAKKAITSRLETAWIWLSYQQTLPLLRLLRTSTAFYTLALGVPTLLAGSLLLLSYLTWYPDNLVLVVSISALIMGSSLIGGMLLFYIFRWDLRALYEFLIERGDIRPIFLRSVSVILAVVISIFLILFIVGLLVEIFSIEHGFVAAILYIAFMSTVALFVVVIELSAFVIVYTTVVYIIVFSFRVLQFLSQRVIESEKGPVLAITAFLTGAGAVLKALSN